MYTFKRFPFVLADVAFYSFQDRINLCMKPQAVEGRDS